MKNKIQDMIKIIDFDITAIKKEIHQLEQLMEQNPNEILATVITALGIARGRLAELERFRKWLV